MILRKIGLPLNEVFGGYAGLTKPLKAFDLMPINSRLSLPMRLTVLGVILCNWEQAITSALTT